MVGTRLLVDPSLPEAVDTAVTHAPGCPWHKAAVSHSGVSASTDGGISARVVGLGRSKRSLTMCAPIRPNWPATLSLWVSDSGMWFFFRADETNRLLIPHVSKLCTPIPLFEAESGRRSPRSVRFATRGRRRRRRVAASALRVRQQRLVVVSGAVCRDGRRGRQPQDGNAVAANRLTQHDEVDDEKAAEDD